MGITRQWHYRPSVRTFILHKHINTYPGTFLSVWGDQTIVYKLKPPLIPPEDEDKPGGKKSSHFPSEKGVNIVWNCVAFLFVTMGMSCLWQSLPSVVSHPSPPPDFISSEPPLHIGLRRYFFRTVFVHAVTWQMQPCNEQWAMSNKRGMLTHNPNPQRIQAWEYVAGAGFGTRITFL